MKIKEGMYVRTTKGIGKVIKVIYFTDEDGDNYRYVLDISKIYIFNDDDIIGEPSYNVIDLIKEGDYVDHCFIQEIISVKDNVMECMLDSDYEFTSTIRNDEIETVLTSEQFEAMEYKVKHD